MQFNFVLENSRIQIKPSLLTVFCPKVKES